MGGDARRSCHRDRGKGFNPRPPRGGRRGSALRRSCCVEFQSTPPAWGATSHHVYRHTVCAVSIHAPRVGGDGLSSYDLPGCIQFQSTPPAWGATAAAEKLLTVINVSLHAPRVGGDADFRHMVRHRPCFNPRPPRGGRPGTSRLSLDLHGRFNPRPPRGGRLTSARPTACLTGFNPRPPRGGRPPRLR